MALPYLTRIVGMSDKELSEATQEILDFRGTGLLCDGKVREIAKIVTETVGDSTYSLSITEKTLMEEVAIRFVQKHK